MNLRRIYFVIMIYEFVLRKIFIAYFSSLGIWKTAVIKYKVAHSDTQQRMNK